MTTPDDVLTFWFGLDPKAWFTKDDAFDKAVRERFGETLEAAARGERDDWAQTPRGRLALVIVLDQLSRNVFRGTPQSFAQDHHALRLAMAGLHDDTLTSRERYFLLLPLMHAEDVEVQRRCVAEFEALAKRDPDPMFGNALDYARRHAAIVERFGRFPHRNAILGRPSTPEEDAFLREPGSSF